MKIEKGMAKISLDNEEVRALCRVRDILSDIFDTMDEMGSDSVLHADGNDYDRDWVENAKLLCADLAIGPEPFTVEVE